MQKLYTSENKVFIYLLKSMLEDHHINCLIKNEQPPLAGEIPSVIAWPELWVMNDDHFVQAQQILQKALNSKFQTAWTCSKCHEQSPGEFNVCWKCGTSRTKS